MVLKKDIAEPPVPDFALTERQIAYADKMEQALGAHAWDAFTAALKGIADSTDLVLTPGTRNYEAAREIALAVARHSIPAAAAMLTHNARLDEYERSLPPSGAAPPTPEELNNLWKEA